MGVPPGTTDHSKETAQQTRSAQTGSVVLIGTLDLSPFIEFCGLNLLHSCMKQNFITLNENLDTF